MPDAFPDAYALALRSQRWELVAPLIHDEACVTFSTGAVHSGKAAVQRAFEPRQSGKFFAIFWRRWKKRPALVGGPPHTHRCSDEKAASELVGFVTSFRRPFCWLRGLVEQQVDANRGSQHRD